MTNTASNTGFQENSMFLRQANQKNLNLLMRLLQKQQSNRSQQHMKISITDTGERRTEVSVTGCGNSW